MVVRYHRTYLVKHFRRSNTTAFFWICLLVLVVHFRLCVDNRVSGIAHIIKTEQTWSLPFPSPCLPSGFDGPPTPKFSVCCALPGTLNGASSLGTMSIKKSNWSDLERAFEISERESVRRLLESAIINARAVISDMKTVF
jgi:hypothetical protein